jgi:hypothetical protein
MDIVKLIGAFFQLSVLNANKNGFGTGLYSLLMVSTADTHSSLTAVSCHSSRVKFLVPYPELM